MDLHWMNAKEDLRELYRQLISANDGELVQQDDLVLDLERRIDRAWEQIERLAGRPSVELLDHLRDVVGAGRQLARIGVEDVHACGNQPPHDPTCPDCRATREAVRDWAVAELALHDLVEKPIRTCRVCGCWEHDPCRDGCWWVDDPEGKNLCSSCQVVLYGEVEP